MKGRTGITPGSAEPRFVGFDILAQADAWDEVTARVVRARLRPPATARFFTAGEEATARVLLDRLLAQDDEPKVPVFEMIDRRLLIGDGDGYRYEDLPEDPQAWRRSLAGLDADAQEIAGRDFASLSIGGQMGILEAIRLTEGRWHDMPAGRIFALWMRYACAAFYSHPWAWNEIGFGGPAYPRGYANLGLNKREHWEQPEVDAADPIPWIQRAETAKKAHAGHLPDINEGRS